MKRTGILCILIAAALLVTSLAAVSADQNSTIDQLAIQNNYNAISGSQTAHAIGGDAIVGGLTINSMNVQAQSAAVTQAGDTIVAGEDIEGSNITLGLMGNQTSNIRQTVSQENTNILLVNATATTDVVIVPCTPANVTIGGDATNSTITGGNVGIGGNATNSSIAGSECEPIVVGGGNAFVGGQTIDSMNVQAQSADVTQTGNTIMAVEDIEDSNIYTGPIVAAEGAEAGAGAGLPPGRPGAGAGAGLPPGRP